MVQFHLSHSDTKYFYPETAADITLEQYVYFHKFILPQYPEVELDALVAQKQMNAAYEKIKPYAKKLGIDLNKLWVDVVQECEIILLTKDVKDNVRRFLPALIDQYNANQKALDKCLEIMDEVWEAQVKYPYMAKVVNYFTGIPLDACYGKVAESLELKYLTFMFTKILNAISVPEELKYKQIYDFNGTLYYLPDKLMAKSTLLEFAEAAQFDKGRKAIENNDAQGLLHVIAVLLRKKDEAYSDEVFQRNCLDFLKLPLQVGFEIGFFFDEVKRELSSRFADLYASQGDGKYAAASKQLNDKYGWYLTIKKIAECGLFNISGLTPLQSSERANLYEVFQYLASKAAEDNLYNEIQKQSKK